MGDIDGYEDLPADVEITNDPALCTELPARVADPLRHELQMTGMFDGRFGDGRATFTSSGPGYWSLDGTYADPQCRNRTTLTGTMTVEFGPYRCSGTGTHQRQNVTDYTTVFDGACDNTSTGAIEKAEATISFRGTQTPCPRGCGSGHPQGAASQIAGTYET